MRFIYLVLALMTSMTFSAYRQYSKPNTLYQYHRVQTKKEKTDSNHFCATFLTPMTKDIQLGKQLFKQNCAQCHNKNMRDDLTGPALADVEKRWSAYPKEDLYNWIRNSQALVDAKHPKAMEVWKKWNKTTMNAFPSLTDEEIESILAYIELN